MALTFGQTAELKPELRLAQAISEFEADLSDAQKTRLRKDKSQSPHPDDVMRLTAEIDRSMQQNGGRCYGTRLTKFLQGVQQFASIGDIMVGGSQFLPACGVWTLVRFSLLSIVQYKSYVDRVSRMFMEISRSAPSYQRMALLYPQSKHLQAHVLEYFILVVQVCHRMLKYSKRSGLKQILHGAYQSSSTDQQDLEKLSLAIRDEMHIETASANQKEYEKSSAFRFTWQRDIDQKRLYRQQAMKLQILDAISAYDYQTTWTQLRKVGNTSLLTGNHEYVAWKHCLDSATLILSARLGAGKSIVLANMVDDLFLNPIGSTMVAYFFCCHDIPQGLIARNIAGAITRQLLKDTEVSTLSPRLIRDHYSIEDFVLVISELLRPLPTDTMAYVILDGIHECDRGTQSEVFAFLAVLQSALRISVCISTRDQQSIIATASTSLAQPFYIEMPRENPDIELYIEQELASLLASGKMAVQDPNIVLEIRDMLVSKSEGMFLWVHLQILLLCFENSDHGIRQFLKELPLPEDLATTYTRLLDKTATTVKESIRTKLLGLIVAAFRPLTVRELQESMSVTPGDIVWDITMLNDLTATFSACGGLIVLDEEQETVRLVHASALQFLQAKNKYLIDDFHERMACIIFTYLNYPYFETSISSSVIPTIEVESFPTGIITSTLGANTQIQQMAIKLLKSRSSKKQDVSRTLAAQRPKVLSKSDFQFQHYARAYWLRHMCEVTRLDAIIRKLLARLIESSKLSLDDESTINNVSYLYEHDMESPKLLCLAVKRGCAPLAELLLKNSKDDSKYDAIYPLKTAILLQNKDMVSVLLKSNKVRYKWPVESGHNPLEMALERGFYEIASIILQHGQGNPNEIIRAESGRTHLTQAVRSGNTTMTKFLLEHTQVDKNKVDDRGYTALHYAVQNNDAKMLSVLLSTADIDVNAKSKYSMTPFFSSVYRKSEPNIIRMLLSDARVDLRTENDCGATVLQMVAHRGDTELTKLILSAARFNSNTAGESGGTALHLACEDSDYEMVRLLLLYGTVDPDAKDYEGRTALQLAYQNGDIKMVKLMLSQGRLNPDVKDKFGSAPLHLASETNAYEKVRPLLSQTKIDPNSVDNNGSTALHRACEKKDQSTVKLLLSDNRVDPNIKNQMSGTALHTACHLDDLETVMLLLSDARLDPNATNIDGTTGLQIACGRGHYATVAVLLSDDRVDINNKSLHGNTALYEAVDHNQLECVKELVESITSHGKDLDPNVACDDGIQCRTPLSRAVLGGNPRMVRELLNIESIEIEYVDKHGETAISIARRLRHTKILNLLLHRQAVKKEDSLQWPLSI